MTPQQTIETPESNSDLTFYDWIQRNSRLLGIGAAIVVAAGIGYWFYLRSGEIKRANAERQLGQAKQSLTAGNPALAQNDLQRVASRYKGTPAGAQAAMLLAQLEYSQGKFAEGLKALEGYTSERAAGPNFAAIWSLTGDGQLAQGKSADAASAYQKAADATSLIGEKGMYLARAARAYQAAGRDAEARTIWERLASDPEMPVRSEANVRLGELTAKPAGKS
jgi:predicted negative regulator of RcsB-dependent stress response